MDNPKDNVISFDNVGGQRDPARITRDRADHPSNHVPGTPPPRGESEAYQTFQLKPSTVEGGTLDNFEPARGESRPEAALPAEFARELADISTAVVDLRSAYDEAA